MNELQEALFKERFLVAAAAKHAFKHPDCPACVEISRLRYGNPEDEAAVLKRSGE